MKKIVVHITSLLLLLTIHSDIFSQMDIYSEINAFDVLRMRQLAKGDSGDHRSFFIRSSSLYFQQPSANSSFFKKRFAYELRNIGVTWQRNDSLGLGSNDASFLPAAGMQQRAHINVAARWGKFYLQLAPEFIKADNTPQQPYQLDPVYANLLPSYYNLVNGHIDMYDRIGTRPYSKTLLGQSSFKFQSEHIAVGMSNESIWWGPGLRNSLILSNNAPSFLHFTLQTVKPLQTSFGHIEAQLISGRLKEVEFANPDDQKMRQFFSWFWIRPKDTFPRSFVGYIATWEPKWTKNLYLGISGSAISYRNNAESRLLVFPFARIERQNRQRLGSFFMRYVMPKEQAEIYLEMGRSDKAAYPTNIIRDSIPMGYTAGFRKLTSVGKNWGYLYFGLELTRLQLPDPRLLLRPNDPSGLPLYNSWYIHQNIRQGYTNDAQVMGAWIGPGSNSQTLQLGWVKGYKKFMLTGERVQHNNDFYYYFFYKDEMLPTRQNTARYWADVSVTAQLQWDYKNILFSAGASSTSLFNYKWTKLDGGFSGASKLSDRRNKQLYASIVWFFDGRAFK